MIESGTLLQNRYRVTKQIGQGGMGAVYIATDERFSSTVAVKQTFFDDPALRRAFEREAHLLNHLRHTALPKVSDHFTEGEGQFLVMEFIEGSDLSELLKERNGSAFPVADVLNWADALLDALDYLHTHEPQVIHRDIKPQNLKLTPRGQIVLLDFGLAKGNSTETRANLTASVFGYSRNYAPLEQIQGTGTDTRSDLYSLAATLYHLLTGNAPVDALTRAGAIINSQPDPLRPAHLAHAQVPAAVGEILRRAMSQNAAHRQASAAEMRAALRRAASALPAHARQAASVFAQGKPSNDLPTMLEALPQSTYGQQQQPQQSPTSDTRGTTQLRQPSATHQSETTIVDGVAYAAPRRRPSTNSFVPVSPDVPPERKSKTVLVGVAVAVLAACALIAFPLMRRSTEATTVALPAASESQNGTLPGAATDAQQPANNSSQTETTRAATDTSSASEMTSAQTGTRGARPANESGTTNGQPANRDGGTTNGPDANGGVNNAAGNEANGVSPNAGASAGRSGGLVLHAPAPISSSDGRSAAAEYDAQRAEDLRKRQQQQQQQLQQQQRPMPPPEEEQFGPPPPGGGRRPPPRRPPPF
jgi:serine/threonine protein kinase